MSLFRHPHLVRGIVHTPHGAFTIVRGVVDLPDEVGDELGWDRIERAGAAAPASLLAHTSNDQRTLASARGADEDAAI